mmetsp:Transcript_22142/g.48430  ORF Transcript_22142/g.48430 Transcript_22142/m.48430 type:complete len:92 (+) Transcript_22142:2620-2895(+)
MSSSFWLRQAFNSASEWQSAAFAGASGPKRRSTVGETAISFASCPATTPVKVRASPVKSDNFLIAMAFQNGSGSGRSKSRASKFCYEFGGW